MTVIAVPSRYVEAKKPEIPEQNYRQNKIERKQEKERRMAEIRKRQRDQQELTNEPADTSYPEAGNQFSQADTSQDPNDLSANDPIEMNRRASKKELARS